MLLPWFFRSVISFSVIVLSSQVLSILTKDYCGAVFLLAKELPLIDLKSDGFLTFRKYINNYAKSEYFISLQTELELIKTSFHK